MFADDSQKFRNLVYPCPWLNKNCWELWVMEAYLEKVRLQEQQSTTSGEVLNSHLHSSSELACTGGGNAERLGLHPSPLFLHYLCCSWSCFFHDVSLFYCTLCSLLTPLFSYSLFCFLIFKQINECMHVHTHAHLSVSHSHSIVFQTFTFCLSFPPLLCLQLLFCELLKGHQSLFSKA